MRLAVAGRVARVEARRGGGGEGRGEEEARWSCVRALETERKKGRGGGGVEEEAGE